MSEDEIGLEDIDSRIKYYKEVAVKVKGVTWYGVPFLRIDYHEDGSESVWCGIEIEEEQFEDFIGK